MRFPKNAVSGIKETWELDGPTNSTMKQNLTAGGFTFVELIVAVALTVVLVGGVLTNYNRFNEDQRVKQTALTLKANLRLAQSKAISAVKPESGCTTFLGYAVGFTSNSYFLQAWCSPEGWSGSRVDISLPGGITFASVPQTLIFAPVKGTLDLTSDLSITLTGVRRSFTILVSPNGSVSDVGFQ